MIYKKSKLNFVPKIQRKHPIYNKRNYTILGSTLFMLVFGSVNLGIYLKLAEKREAVRSIASINLDLNEKIQSLSHSSAESLSVKDAAVRQALEDKIYWADAFKELSMIVPSNVWLTEFQSSMVDGKRVMNITGQSSSNKKMSEFFSALEQSYFFRDVQMRFSEKLGQFSPDLFRFKFDCNVADQPKVGEK